MGRACSDRPGRGITGVTAGPRDLVFPSDAPSGQQWVYQCGFPFQISPTEAALFCNIRVCGTRIVDIEAGTDVVIFDRLDRIGPERATPLLRIEEVDHPRTGERVYLVGGCVGGFVPLGARRPDGSPHPYAGTGFGLCHVMGYPARLEQASDTHLDMNSDIYTFIEVQQYAYDGRRFQVTDRRRYDLDGLLPGWSILSFGLSPAIPSGDDLLFGISSDRVNDWDSGLSRWRRGPDGRWLPVAYRLLNRHTMEPTLVRDLDGALLMAFRPWMPTNPRPRSLDILRSADEGETWQPVIREEVFNLGTPLLLCRAADGTPYVVTNRYREPLLHRHAKREMIWLWPLADDRRRLLEPMLVRDGTADLGPPPNGSVWRLDHPSGCTVRLADGRWRHVLAYRVLEDAEMRTNAGATPMTGCYVEEVFSAGPAEPPWHFEEKPC
jgi:hypothetical protein